MSNLKHVLASFEKAKQNLINTLKKNTKDAGLHLENIIVDNTPVQEGTLADSIHTGDVAEVGTKIIVEVGTNLDYAPHVEFGVTAKTKTGKVRKNPYDYYKGDRKFYRGTGAGMFRRSSEQEQDTIKDIIKNGG